MTAVCSAIKCNADRYATAADRTGSPFRRRPALGMAAGLALVVCAALAAPAARAAEHGDGHQAAASGHGGHEGGHEGGGETAPETFVVLDLFSEALEASVAGIGIKIAELKPKVEHINELYHDGRKHQAFAQVLGISTEVVVLGFFIETFGIGDLFVSALSFTGNWAMQMAQSTVGVMASTKVALFAGEKVEEATEEKYEHAIHAEAHATHATHAEGKAAKAKTLPKPAHKGQIEEAQAVE